MVAAEPSSLPTYGAASLVSSHEKGATRRKHMRSATLALVGATAVMALLFIVAATGYERGDAVAETELVTGVKAVKAELAAARAGASAHAKAKIAAKANVAHAAKAAVKAKVTTAKISQEQKIEKALRSNLDRTTQALERKRLQPLLVSQGQSVLHNKDGITTTKLAPVKSLKAQMKSDAAPPNSQEDATEDALRNQLDAKTKAKQEALFKAAVAAQQLASSPKKGSNKAADAQNVMSMSASPAKAQSASASFRAQLEDRVKQKEKQMFKSAYQGEMEKENHIHMAKAQKDKYLKQKETEMFKATLHKAKLDSTQIKHREELREEGRATTETASKPSFKQWLSAFKAQLTQRTANADKQLVEKTYGKNKAEIPAALKHAGARESKAKKAISLLNKSIGLEEKEEKAVQHASEYASVPAQALKQLKATMKDERSALSSLTTQETGAKADPNVLALAPKAKTANKDDGDAGLLGLDDLNA